MPARDPSVRLEPARRLVGRWDFCDYVSFCGHKGVESRFNIIRFTDSERFLLSVRSADRGEILDRGTYELDGDELLLRYDGSRYQELYTFEFDESDTLLLRSREGRSLFRRPADVSESLRNKTEISGLTE